jgi:hypothetical protein
LAALLRRFLAELKKKILAYEKVGIPYGKSAYARFEAP